MTKQEGRRNGRAPIKRLTKEELVDLRLRREIVARAQTELLMLCEANQAWAKLIQEKYDLTPQFDIDVRTGKLTRKEKASRG